jgi:hypothetical protein
MQEGGEGATSEGSGPGGGALVRAKGSGWGAGWAGAWAGAYRDEAFPYFVAQAHAHARTQASTHARTS